MADDICSKRLCGQHFLKAVCVAIPSSGSPRGRAVDAQPLTVNAVLPGTHCCPNISEERAPAQGHGAGKQQEAGLKLSFGRAQGAGIDHVFGGS